MHTRQWLMILAWLPAVCGGAELSRSIVIEARGSQMTEARLTAIHAQLVKLGMISLNGQAVMPENAAHGKELGFVKQHLVISQAIGGDQYLANANSIHVVLSGRVLATGDTLDVCLVDAGMFDYVSVLGAPMRLRSYREAPAKAPAIADLIAALKAGRVFYYVDDAPIDCPTCKGTRFESYKDSGVARRRPCRACRATGKGVRPTWHRLNW